MITLFLRTTIKTKVMMLIMIIMLMTITRPTTGSSKIITTIDSDITTKQALQ